MLFLQPIEIDYLKDLEKHGVSLTEYPLLKLLDSFPLYGHKPHTKKFVSLEMHPWVLSLQKALESFVLSEVIMIPLVARQPNKFLCLNCSCISKFCIAGAKPSLSTSANVQLVVNDSLLLPYSYSVL